MSSSLQNKFGENILEMCIRIKKIKENKKCILGKFSINNWFFPLAVLDHYYRITWNWTWKIYSWLLSSQAESSF